MQSLSLLDTGGTTRNVIAGTINSETVMLISTNEFDIAASNSITGFDRVKKGITLVNTQLASNGVTELLKGCYKLLVI